MSWGLVNFLLVQILVKVASTQVRTLRANVGKGFMTMEVSHELVDPKVMVNSTQKGILPGEKLASSQVESCSNLLGQLTLFKGPLWTERESGKYSWTRPLHLNKSVSALFKMKEPKRFALLTKDGFTTLLYNIPTVMLSFLERDNCSNGVQGDFWITQILSLQLSISEWSVLREGIISQLVCGVLVTIRAALKIWGILQFVGTDFDWKGGLAFSFFWCWILLTAVQGSDRTNYRIRSPRLEAYGQLEKCR